MPIEGVIQTGTDTDGNPIYGPFSKPSISKRPQTIGVTWLIVPQENFVYDASFVKLRQVSLEYSLPSKLIG